MALTTSLRTIPIVSLFCGPGGMDLGFRKQGFQPILAIDVDQAAVDTYNWNNRRSIARQGDLLQLTDTEIINLIREVSGGISPRGVIGGPPCQSFSTSNVHHKRNDPRKKLPLRYASILGALNREFNLDFFVFENVLGLKSNKHKYHFRKLLKAFENVGFSIFEEELDASKFGVPQERHRVFIVGINKRLYPKIGFEFPCKDTDIPVTVRDVIEGLPAPAYFKRKIRVAEIPYHPNHWTMNPKSPKFKNGSNGIGRSFRRLHWDRPSWTVAYGHREMHVHPTGTRRVSVFEAMLLQGFPESYVLKGNLSQQVTQVSDAVPPPLAGAIAKAMRRAIYNHKGHIQKKLLAWFKENKRTFPWRETNDPYKILIAEKLLQQTAATQKVVEVYQEIVKRYPTIEALSRATAVELRPLIKPLGLIYRADELPRLAHQIVSRHAGKIPTELNALLDLPGIGDYSARAILSFAYGQDLPVVDTNIARLIHRIYGIPDPLPKNPARSKRLIQMASAIVPQGHSRDFNLASLDLCAAVCTSRQPNCAQCPLSRNCHYGQTILT